MLDVCEGRGRAMVPGRGESRLGESGVPMPTVVLTHVTSRRVMGGRWSCDELGGKR